MEGSKIQKFIALAGNDIPAKLDGAAPVEKRALGAQLLLSEVLEYVIRGLGITPVVDGTPIRDPNTLEYSGEGAEVDTLEMVDGLADVAYTMYWNAISFGIPLEEAFSLVCDNNLEKFVTLDNAFAVGLSLLPEDLWHCGQNVSWPSSVVAVQVVEIDGSRYAVGKDARGKVRKPSTYNPVNLQALAAES